MDPCSFSLGGGFDSWKFPSWFTTPYWHTIGISDSYKAKEKCALLGQNGVIVELPLLGKVCGGSCLVQFYIGTLKWDPKLSQNKPICGGYFIWLEPPGTVFVPPWTKCWSLTLRSVIRGSSLLSCLNPFTIFLTLKFIYPSNFLLYYFWSYRLLPVQSEVHSHPSYFTLHNCTFQRSSLSSSTKILLKIIKALWL